MRLIEINSIESLAFVVHDDIGLLGDKEDNEAEEVIILFHDRNNWKDSFLEL
jgi:hypothetical protein